MEEQTMQHEEMILILNGIGPKVSARLQPPLHFFPDDEISIAMTKMSFYNSFSNVREKLNNELNIQPGKKVIIFSFKFLLELTKLPRFVWK